MTFQPFLQSINSPDLRAVAVHWNEARGEELMPAWSDIRPSAMAKQLPIVWSYVYDADKDEFVGRLGGDAITRIFDKSIKGAKLSELSSIVSPERLIARLKRVIGEPALVRGEGPMFKQNEQHGIGERIIMPLGNSGVADSVLGATAYRLQGVVPSGAQITEQEDWFSLS